MLLGRELMATTSNLTQGDFCRTTGRWSRSWLWAGQPSRAVFVVSKKGTASTLKKLTFVMGQLECLLFRIIDIYPAIT